MVTHPVNIIMPLGGQHTIHSFFIIRLTTNLLSISIDNSEFTIFLADETPVTDINTGAAWFT